VRGRHEPVTFQRLNAVERPARAALAAMLILVTAGAAPALAAGQPPVASDQSAKTHEATPLGVVLNATDPENDPLTFTVVSGPSHGALDDCSGGSCTYTPNVGFTGLDTFSWIANDGTSDSNTATFSITTTPTWTALQIAQSIASDTVTVTGASFVAVPPNNFPNGVYTSPLSGFPVDGSTFGILTSGDVNSVDEPGTFASTDDGGGAVRGDTDDDVSILKIDLDVSPGANCLSFDFKFLSEEFPSFVGSSFNDAFIAELDTSDWTTSGSTISAPHNFAFDSSSEVVSVNSTGLGGMSAARGAGTAFDGTTTGAGADPSGGATDLLGAATPVTAGAHSVYLSLFDQGDTSLDSAVFIDNLRVGSVPNPALDCTPGATQPAHLTLTKSIDNTGGGTAAATDWTLSATGPTSISGTTGSPAVTNAVVSPGTYTLAETGPSGYTPGAWRCTGGGLTGSSLSLAAGDNASCSITNTFTTTDDASGFATGNGSTTVQTTPDGIQFSILTVPSGFPGAVTLHEFSEPCALPTGTVCIGQTLDLTAPSTTAANPLVLKILVAKSALIGRLSIKNGVLYHTPDNGDQALVPRCANGSKKTASPAPSCLSSIKGVMIGGVGYWQYLVYTQDNGRWRPGIVVR